MPTHQRGCNLSGSGIHNLLPYSIPNMFGYGEYAGEKAIILDLLGDDFLTLIKGGVIYGQEYFEAVCQWATQVVRIAQWPQSRMRFYFRFISSIDRSAPIYSPARVCAW